MRARLTRLAAWAASDGIVIGVWLFILAITLAPLWRAVLHGGS
jgi:hypothetical protein